MNASELMSKAVRAVESARLLLDAGNADARIAGEVAGHERNG